MIHDEVIDFISYWSDRTGYGVRQFARWLGLSLYEGWDVEFQCERGVIRMGTNAGLRTSRPQTFERGRRWELTPDPLPHPAWPETPVLRGA